MSRANKLAGLLLAALLATAVPPAQAQTVYISDELTVPIRTGPSTGHRILRILPAGTALEVRERDEAAGYARVVTRAGTEGWVPLQYLVNQPIARDRLEAAQREIQRLSETVTALRAELRDVTGERSAAQETSETLSAQVTRLEQELAEIKRISAGAIETEAANQRLTELNARLREELDALVDERDRLQENAQQRWLMLGGGLVLVGLLLGVIIKSRPRRSAWT
jgi:SH3 domain protein